MSKLTKIIALTKWHPWFAWFPVCLKDGRIVWLAHVERNGGYDHSKNTDRKPRWRWSYRAALQNKDGSHDA